MLEVPELQPGQVVVKVMYSGLCGTQLMEMQGKKGPDRYLPHTLGHEGAGVVIEIGEGVKKVQPGQNVVLSWIKGGGADVGKSVYRSEKGPVNSGAVSTFMEYAVVSENRVTPIPHWLPLKEASLLGCAVPTGAGIVFNTLKVKEQDSVAIFGIGGVGLSAFFAAQSVGARIIVIDQIDNKLQQAKKLGAWKTINITHEDPMSVIAEVTNGRGVDHSIEAAGQVTTMELAFQVTKEQGGTCVLAGNLEHGGEISLDPFALIKGKRLLGTCGGETTMDQDLPRFASLYQQGSLMLGQLISQVFPLGEINTAFEAMKKGVMGRVLIDVSSLSSDSIL
ncbi:MAG: dehydrogenase [Nitrospirales bacterium]|nr:MAG: dehydrogenase [Nitrospirales bacterium]